MSRVCLLKAVGFNRFGVPAHLCFCTCSSKDLWSYYFVRLVKPLCKYIMWTCMRVGTYMMQVSEPAPVWFQETGATYIHDVTARTSSRYALSSNVCGLVRGSGPLMDSLESKPFQIWFVLVCFLVTFHIYPISLPGWHARELTSLPSYVYIWTYLICNYNNFQPQQIMGRASLVSLLRAPCLHLPAFMSFVVSLAVLILFLLSVERYASFAYSRKTTTSNHNKFRLRMVTSFFTLGLCIIKYREVIAGALLFH